MTALLLGWPIAGFAVGLGPVQEQSALGQPLRVVIPLLLGPGENLAGECFRLVAAERDADGVPQALFGRVVLERIGENARLVVTHHRPVNDPALRLTIEAGCGIAVRREFTLLLDPPAIEVPAVAAESAPSAAVPTPSRVAREGGRRRAGVSASAAPSAPRASAAGAQRSRKASPAKAAGAAAMPPRRAPPRATERPRLEVSRATPRATADASLGEGMAPTPQQVQAQQDLANALEAETVVLRQRVAELTAMVERMQEQVRLQEAQQRAAEEAAKAAADAARNKPQAWGSRWWEANWPLVALIVGAPLLIAGVLLRKRRNTVLRAEHWPVSGPLPEEFDAPAPRAEMPPRPRAGTIDTKPTPGPARKPAGGANALAVSELSQITEEARVYVALGHVDRAMQVLREHLREAPRSLPAAWLMLLDLYHAHGRRQEFRQLAQEFHQHCNVQAPVWEDISAREQGAAGLHEYPHVTQRLVGLWRMPECRDYLERLLYDNRDGQRSGFSLAAYGDILTLLQVLDASAVDIDSDLAEEGKLRAASSSSRRAAVVNPQGLPSPDGSGDAPSRPPSDRASP